MKKVFFLLILFFSVFSSVKPVLGINKNFWRPELEDNVVINPFQGLGICHNAESTIPLSDPLVTWAYHSSAGAIWSEIEPREGEFHWEKLDEVISKVNAAGKKIWLQIYNDGSIPQWALEKEIGGERMKTVGGAVGCESMNSRLPLPWDEVYLTLWERVIEALAAKYDRDPRVEAIVIMAGGGYGEMAGCSTCGLAQCWALEAGCCPGNDVNRCSGCKYSPGVPNRPTDECARCLNSKFTEAVKNLIDLYLTHFVNKPINLQLGGGLYHQTRSVIRPVLTYAIPKYGLRVLLKSNSWCHADIPYCHGQTGDRGHDGEAQDFVLANTTAVNPGGDRTKFGLEPAGWADTVSAFNNLANTRRRDLLSYLCLQPFYWQETRLEAFRATRERLAQDLGSKVALVSIDYPEQVEVNQRYPVTVVMKNLGNIPPMRPERQGEKDIASSYQLSFQLVKNGRVVFEDDIEPNVPTNEWVKGNDYRVGTEISLPNHLFSGRYELRLALRDPEAQERFRQEYFRFLNKERLDSEGRMIIGWVDVLGRPSPMDFNDDGFIDETDLTILLNRWGTLFDQEDLVMLLSNWRVK